MINTFHCDIAMTSGIPSDALALKQVSVVYRFDGVGRKHSGFSFTAVDAIGSVLRRKLV